jgi:hypothetical protein
MHTLRHVAVSLVVHAVVKQVIWPGPRAPQAFQQLKFEQRGPAPAPRHLPPPQNDSPGLPPSGSGSVCVCVGGGGGGANASSAPRCLREIGVDHVCGVSAIVGTRVSAPVVVNAAGPHSSGVTQMAFPDPTENDMALTTRAMRQEVTYVCDIWTEFVLVLHSLLAHHERLL